MIDSRLRNAILILVAAVWGISQIAALVVPGYEPDQTIHVVFMTIAGGILALDRRDKDDQNRGGGSDGDSS